MTIEISSVARNILVEEILIQADLTLAAHARVRKLTLDLETKDNRLVWGGIQSLLNHAAMISKILLPDTSNNKYVRYERSRKLKETLNVKDQSLLLRRTVRNNVEHLDDRLDAWIEQGSTRLLEATFENRSGYDFLNKNGRRWFVKRVYLVAEDVFLTEGQKGSGIDEICIADLIVEIRQVRKQAQDCLDRDGSVVRLPSTS